MKAEICIVSQGSAGQVFVFNALRALFTRKAKLTLFTDTARRRVSRVGPFLSLLSPFIWLHKTKHFGKLSNNRFIHGFDWIVVF